jgi:hypothetical protein
MARGSARAHRPRGRAARVGAHQGRLPHRPAATGGRAQKGHVESLGRGVRHAARGAARADSALRPRSRRRLAGGLAGRGRAGGRQGARRGPKRLPGGADGVRELPARRARSGGRARGRRRGDRRNGRVRWAVHDGRLVVSGTYSGGFSFSHADGNRYGAPEPDPARSKVLVEVFQILASMGFRQREARQMLDEASPHVGAQAGVEEALRTVLRRARVSYVAERIVPYGEAGGGMDAWWRGHGAAAAPYPTAGGVGIVLEGGDAEGERGCGRDAGATSRLTDR